MTLHASLPLLATRSLLYRKWGTAKERWVFREISVTFDINVLSFGFRMSPRGSHVCTPAVQIVGTGRQRGRPVRSSPTLLPILVTLLPACCRGVRRPNFTPLLPWETRLSSLKRESEEILPSVNCFRWVVCLRQKETGPGQGLNEETLFSVHQSLGSMEQLNLLATQG